MNQLAVHSVLFPKSFLPFETHRVLEFVDGCTLCCGNDGGNAYTGIPKERCAQRCHRLVLWLYVYVYILCTCIHFYLKETPVWHIWTRSTLLCDAVTVSFWCPQSKVVPYGVQGVRSTRQLCKP